MSLLRDTIHMKWNEVGTIGMIRIHSQFRPGTNQPLPLPKTPPLRSSRPLISTIRLYRTSTCELDNSGLDSYLVIAAVEKDQVNFTVIGTQTSDDASNQGKQLQNATSAIWTYLPYQLDCRVHRSDKCRVEDMYKIVYVHCANKMKIQVPLQNCGIPLGHW